MKIRIEYCKECDLLFEAISIMEEMMSDPKLQLQIEEIVLHPTSGRVLEVYLNDQLLFSKKNLNRFLIRNEISSLVGEYHRENRVTIKG